MSRETVSKGPKTWPGLRASTARENFSPLRLHRRSANMLQPGKSAVALPAALGHLLGRMDRVGNKSALDAFPAVLDLDVPAPHQLKDFPRQIHKCLRWQNLGEKKMNAEDDKSV